MILLTVSLHICTPVSNRARREATPYLLLVVGIIMWLSFWIYVVIYVRSVMQHERAAASDSTAILRRDQKLNRTLFTLFSGGGTYTLWVTDNQIR